MFSAAPTGGRKMRLAVPTARQRQETLGSELSDFNGGILEAQWAGRDRHRTKRLI